MKRSAKAAGKLAIIVTAGPTVEDIDPVRYISNRSSGKLGIEIAKAALHAGHRVVLIHGPVSAVLLKTLPASSQLTVIQVRSAAQMHAAVMERLAAVSAVVMNAAVADYTPAKNSAIKLKKSPHEMVLRLKPTADILAELRRQKQRRGKKLILIGFALESGSGRTAVQRQQSRLAEARRKLKAKSLNAIVLDTPQALGSDRADFTLVPRHGKPRHFRSMTKQRLAREVIRIVAEQSGNLP